jgi:signal transduction histidine kinase
MSTLTPARDADASVDPSPAAALAGMSPDDLAQILGAFTEASAKLQTVHETLRAEVSRLKAELREANEALERSRRLAALGEMAAGISHEVRNPLGSIRLYARMLEEDLADRPSERATAGKILAAVRGLDAVVGDVLAFAKEMRLRPAELDAADLFDRAIDECADGAGVEVVRSPRASGVRLTGDESLLHRALVNVVQNAVQAVQSPENRSGVRRVELSAERRDGEIVLRVADSGPGIPPEVRERIFNPFFTTRATGTGLGLAIVHRILDAHGGRVVVASGSGPHAESGGLAGAVVDLVVPTPEARPATPLARPVARADSAAQFLQPREGGKPMNRREDPVLPSEDA